jgi:hypothetical protein
VYPRGLIAIKSKNKPNPKAKKNTQDFLNRTVIAAKSPIKKGIVVIPLKITANKVSKTTSNII